MSPPYSKGSTMELPYIITLLGHVAATVVLTILVMSLLATVLRLIESDMLERERVIRLLMIQISDVDKEEIYELMRDKKRNRRSARMMTKLIRGRIKQRKSHSLTIV